MPDHPSTATSRLRTSARALAFVLLAVALYYAVQAARDRRGIVAQVLATSGEPTIRTPIDVTHVLASHVPVGTADRDAIGALRRGGFDVEAFDAAAYEWLGYACAGCDRGAWGRYSQSFLRGGERIVVGVGFRDGRVAHLEARRMIRIIEVP